VLSRELVPTARSERTQQRAQGWRLLYLTLGSALIATQPGLGVCVDGGSSDQPQVTIAPRVRRPDGNSPPASIRLDVKVVLIPVSVTDSFDHPVNDLPPDAFRLLEDNVEQKIACFFKDEAPVSVGLIFDASGSMRKSIDRSLAAVQQFFKTAVPGDEFFLIRFSDKPTVETNFTSDPAEILEHLSFVHPDGWTALYDAIYLGVHRMKPAKNTRRVLFILSDGGDNNSRYTEAEVKNLVMESDVRIYAIGLFDRPKFLEKLAALTGGEAFWAHSLKDLPGAVDKLTRTLRNQYVLGYSPNKSENDGKYRKIRIELAHPFSVSPLRLLWRRGYYAPYAPSR
jgi:Ca-activated chloride channel family protein